MGMFTPHYLKEGPGISKNTPPKTGLALFFEILTREFWELIKLNLLFVLYCVPIVTIGPALGALSAVTVKMVRDEPNDPIPNFKAAFRREFRPCFAVGLLGAIIATLLLSGIFICISSKNPLLLYAGTSILCALLLFAGLTWGYLFPIIMTVDLPLRTALKNAALLPLLCLRHSLPALLAAGGWTALWLRFFPLSIPLLLVAGFSFASFIWSFAAWHDCKRYLIRPAD